MFEKRTGVCAPRAAMAAQAQIALRMKDCIAFIIFRPSGCARSVSRRIDVYNALVESERSLARHSALLGEPLAKDAVNRLDEEACLRERIRLTSLPGHLGRRLSSQTGR